MREKSHKVKFNYIQCISIKDSNCTINKYMSSPNRGCFSCWWLLLGATKLAIFSQHNFHSLKAHAHYFTVLVYLATWRAAKLGIFTHFMSIKLPQCNQSINSLMYVYYTDPQLFFMSVWPQLWLHFFVLPPSPPPKNKFYITPWTHSIFYVIHGWLTIN